MSQKLPPTYIEGWSNLETIRKIPYNRLGKTDLYVSQISLGAAHVSKEVHVKRASDGSVVEITGADEPIAAIREAVRLGVNLIDTSPFYGLGVSELIVGQALKDLPRKAYYIATKAGRQSDATWDFSGPAIRRSVEQSMKKLGVDHIDLLQLHDVEFGNLETILTEALSTIDQLKREGKVTAIGITGYPLNVLKEIIEKSPVKLDTILSYCRHTLWEDELANYLPFFESKDLGVINASTFGMGLYSLAAPISYWHPAPKEIQNACQEASKFIQSKGQHINRLAMLYSMKDKRIHSHLTGMESPEMAVLNIKTLASDFSQSDRELVSEMMEKYFKNLKVRNWEGVEVEKYRKDPIAFADFLKKPPK